MPRPKRRPVDASSVRADWIACLPAAKQQAFHDCSKRMETSYLMLSVSLDEAIHLRNLGSFQSAIQSVSILSGLCRRLTGRLQDTLGSLEQSVKARGMRPSANPLDPADFLGRRSRFVAHKSYVLSHVFFTPRAGFLYKIAVLQELVSSLRESFCRAAEDLSSTGPAAMRLDLWARLDEGHYDLNTCLRESIVMLKCFLRVLPEDHLPHFQHSLSSQMSAPHVARHSPRTLPSKIALSTGA